jgi:hypothetical protein
MARLDYGRDPDAFLLVDLGDLPLNGALLGLQLR